MINSTALCSLFDFSVRFSTFSVIVLFVEVFIPVISRFYGILIAMYFNDHNPPHFHAKYSGQEALFNFDGELLEGELPKRAIKFVREWISFHKAELEDNWEKARTGQPLNNIEPLE